MKHFTYLKSCLLLGLLGTVSPLANAQEPVTKNLYNKVSIASPTAASLGKYADIPVSYHTGIPQISVPIYTIKEGSLTVPISLSYHAGGMKVQEAASWVGAGWALNAGGVITRTVIGGPDEKGTCATSYRGHFSDYGYNSYLKNYTGYLWPIPQGADFFKDTSVNDLYNLQYSHYDTEPDLFFFNFNGYSGKFFFSDDRTPILVEGNDLKIEYYYPTPAPDGNVQTNNKSANIQGFIITVPTGDKYYFGITDNLAISGADPVETTFPFSTNSNGTPDNVYSSYYLNKIVAADGVHVIKFSYQAEKYSYYTVSMIPVLGNEIKPAPLIRNEYGLVKNNIEGVRLAKVEFSTGYIDFNASQNPRADLGKYASNIAVMVDEPNEEAKALSEIAIHGDDFCKTIGLSYSYFEDNFTNLAPDLGVSYNIISDKKRLRLNSVVEKSCDGTASSNPWQFEYYSNFLPRRLSFAQDHWGFNNGKVGNNGLNTLIPTFSLDPLVPAQTTNTSTAAIVPGADRDSAWPAMEEGTLTKIIYPTGGSSTFVYESNTAWISYVRYENRQVATVAAGRNAGGTLAPQPITLPVSPNGYKVTLRLTVDSSNPTSSGTATFAGPSNSLYVTKDRLYDEIVIPPTSTPSTWTLRADDNTGPVALAEAYIYERVIVNGQENALAGGLRIKNITAQTNTLTPALVTNYSYEQNGKSTATLYSRPRYVLMVRNNTVARYGWVPDWDSDTKNLNSSGCIAPDFSGAGNAFLASPSPTVPMSTTQGSHIGYDEVAVAQTGNGRSEYYYYGGPDDKRYEDVCYRVIAPTICDPNTPTSPVLPLPFEFTRGQVKFERVFDETGKLLKESQYTYKYDSSKIKTPVYIVKFVLGGGILPNYYEKKSYWKTQMDVIENNTDANGQQGLQIKKTYKYDSPYHHQLTQSTTTSTGSDIIETRNQYVSDFRVPATISIPDGSATYDAACVECDRQMAAASATCTTSGCFDIAYLSNRVCRANARKAYVAYRRANFTDRTNAFQTAHDAAKNAADGTLKPLLQLQDDFTNHLVEASHWKNGQLLSASYTLFGPGLSLPYAMYPAKEFTLSLTSPAATFAPAIISGPTITLDPRYPTIPETTLHFDKGNLVELKPRAGTRTAYLWGYNNTLPIATAVGVSYTTLSAAYARAGSTLAPLRSDPALGRALVTTYVHRPLVGLTSQTDPTGRATSFEYDGLGRLIRTRDEQGHILSQQQYHYAGTK